MADTGGKKGKKKKGKGKTLNLTEFLAGDGKPPPVLQQLKKVDRGDEDLEIDDDSYESRRQANFDLSKLPTGPKSARESEVDMSKLPKSPPFTAFVGNLPYEVSDEEIRGFFDGIQIVNIRLIREGGKQKGYGYAEFADLTSLVQALGLNNNPMGNRKLRVDIAENTGHSQTDGGPRREESREEKVSDWRAGGREVPPPSGRMNGFSDGDRYSGRSDRGFRDGFSRDGDRGYRDGDRGGFRDGDRGGFRDGDRGGFRDSDRGGFRDGDRGGFRRYDDRGPDRGQFGDRERGGRDGGFDRFDRGGRGRPGPERSEADGVDTWRRGPDSAPRGDGDSAWRREPMGSNRGDSHDMPERRTRGYGPPKGDFDEGRGGGSWRSGGGRPPPNREFREPNEPVDQSEPPRERKRLNLLPRSIPVEPQKQDDVSGSSIFGGARPVDTASREREIEARLSKTEATAPGQTWGRESGKSYGGSGEETTERGDEVWRDDGVKKDRTRVMRPDLLSEEERSPRDRTISTGSERSGDDAEDRAGRVVLRKSLSRESKDEEDGVAVSKEGRTRSGSGSRGRGGPRGGVAGRGRGSPPFKGGQSKKKPSDIGKYEEPAPPNFGKQSMYSVLAADDDAEDEESDNDEKN